MTTASSQAIEIPPRDREAAIIIALHGRGSNPSDIAGLAQDFSVAGARWIIPAAPISMGRGFTWYSGMYTDLSSENRAEFQAARSVVLSLIRRVRSQSGDLPIVLLGFSQGAVMSLDLALRGPESVSAAIVLSGGLYDLSSIASMIVKPSPPVFWAHGVYDRILPIQSAREQAALLRNIDVDISFREYGLDHNISAEVVNDAREYLSKALF